MPEIMSAEDTIKELEKILVNARSEIMDPITGNNVEGWPFVFSLEAPSMYDKIQAEAEKRKIDFIHSRDSAMLEKYKEAMSKWLYGMMDGYPNTNFNKMEDTDMRCALDSTFAEIDGGK